MGLRQFFKPSVFSLAVTALLVVYFVCAIPVMRVNQTNCIAGTDRCNDSASKTTTLDCLRIKFHEEFTYQVYAGPTFDSVRTCIELDVVWVIPALLFAFLLSSLGSASLKYSMQAYRHGSKTEILTFILVIVTVIPGMLYTIIEQKISLDVYFFFPYNFLFVFAAFLKGYLAIFSFILAVTPVGVAYYLVNLLKKWEIRHVWFYFIWLFFLVIFALGVILAAVGLHPYPY
jgi:hypothetical protein